MKKRPFWLGLGVGAIAAGLIGLLPAVLGAINMTASGGGGPIDRLGHAMWEASTFWRAPDEKNPFAEDESAVARGFEHYKSMCVACHGAPNVNRAAWAQGMHPVPPDLTAGEAPGRSDGKLFYTVRNGVRMTGMPAFGHGHSEEDIWHIVAFLRRLGSLTEEQENQLKEAVGRDAHDHAGHKPAEHEHKQHEHE